MNEPLTKNLWLLKFALGFVGKRSLRELDRVSRDGKKAQVKTLRRILEASKDTVYGKEHHFREILRTKSPEDLFRLYQDNVSVNDYEALRPYVERHKNGESGVLFPGKPRMYATTSGTTKEPKWIPINEVYYQDVYKQMNQFWFAQMIQSKPRVFDGPCLSIVGKAIEGKAPDGTVYGSISGVTQRDIPNFMKVLHTAPADVFHITDYKARYYAIMRMGIERDTHCVITPNPSTLVEMQNNVNEFYDDYCSDIESGTVSRKFPISGEIRTILENYTKPNPARAAELRELKKKYGTVLPKHYWPNLQMISMWACGNTRIYLDTIKNTFPSSTALYEMGYFSTECRSGIVMKSGVMDTVPFAHKHYFEFIHESDLDNPNPKLYQIHEVRTGERYVMVVTTSAGLFRYNMNDLLEITGWYNQFPTIKFIQKVNGIISLTGEKVHERQFVEAVQETAEKSGKKIRFFVGFANPNTSNYSFYYEFQDQDVKIAEAEQFTAQVDGYIKEFNMEYKDKRASNRVKAPETALLGPESFERFKAKCIDLGYRDGQFKLNLLMQDEKRHAMFKELVK